MIVKELQNEEERRAAECARRKAGLFVEEPVALVN